MSRFRKDDESLRCWFRTDRWMMQNKKWFFHTRERTLEGPFASRQDAVDGLTIYIDQNSSTRPTWTRQRRVG